MLDCNICRPCDAKADPDDFMHSKALYCKSPKTKRNRGFTFTNQNREENKDDAVASKVSIKEAKNCSFQVRTEGQRR